MTGIPGVVASEVPEQAEEMAELRRRIAACFQFVLDRQSFLTSPSPTSSAPEAVFHSAPPGPRVKVSHVFTEGQDTYSSQEVPGRSCFAGLQLPTRPVGTSCKSTTLRAGTKGVGSVCGWNSNWASGHLVNPHYQLLAARARQAFEIRAVVVFPGLGIVLLSFAPSFIYCRRVTCQDEKQAEVAASKPPQPEEEVDARDPGPESC